MSRFLLTNAAKADLKSIGRYTQETWGIEQRNLYLTLLDRSFHDLVVNPLMGKDCGDIRPGYRKLPVGKHLVFYRQKEPDLIEIVRVLHERMDSESHLTSG
ncbi:type II toxin-antitoxin system RelE/ParE family toxin [Methylomonas montana]|uniref:type II toxin-antitoxin system RelE/ParE family toxin n=1 Tax=Methylomonas montana TaxID=3058963 RepID=UPI00265A77AE|nr:type II toxin-antitoxin system RelE/ParE family toxin [Methylomonas montana]WKJ89077.1 type II toxin-antitoxin system RelE/ParE family toxin [Methylomonas montana]